MCLTLGLRLERAKVPFRVLAPIAIFIGLFALVTVEWMFGPVIWMVTGPTLVIGTAMTAGSWADASASGIPNWVLYYIVRGSSGRVERQHVPLEAGR